MATSTPYRPGYVSPNYSTGYASTHTPVDLTFGLNTVPGYVGNTYQVSAPDTFPGTFPSAPTPPMNLDYGSSVSRPFMSNETTLPLGSSPISWAPTLASPSDMTSMTTYLKTPGSFNAPISSASTGFAGGSLDLSNPMSSFGSSLTSKLNSASTSSPSWFSSLGDFASKNKDLISGVSGLAQAGLGAFNAWNSNQTAKDQLKFQKEAFGKQYEAQKSLTNSQLEDRQRRRVAEQPNLALGVEEYMNKYGVK